MKKRILFAIIAIFAMMESRVLAYDFSAVTSSGQTLYYTIHGSSVSVTHPLTTSTNLDFWAGYAKPTGNMIIPSNVTNGGIAYAVTEIEPLAFTECDSLTGVTIPNTVTKIGRHAFRWCYNLSEVSIGNAVDSIEYYAFCCCYGLTSVTIPASVTYIGRQAFAGDTNLIVVNILTDSCGSFWKDPFNPGQPAGRTFEGCKHLDTVNIGNSVRYLSIDFYTGRDQSNNLIRFGRTNYDGTIFQWCNIQFDSSIYNPLWWSQNLYATDATIIDNISNVVLSTNTTQINKNVFAGVIIDTMVVPSTITTIDGQGLNVSNVKYTGTLHQWCNIDYVNPMNSSHKLFFADTLLTNLVIPQTISTIKPYTFYGCYLIENIELHNSIISIGERAFYGCGTNYLRVPSSVSFIGKYAFSYIDTVFIDNNTPPLISGNPTDYYGLILVPCDSYENYSNNSIWYNLCHNNIVKPKQYTHNISSYNELQGVVLEEANDPTSDCTTLFLNAVPNTGYVFTHWSDGDTNAIRTITIIKDTALIAYFEGIPVEVSVTNVTPEFGSFSGDGLYHYGDTVTLVAHPIEHYHFLSWINNSYGHVQVYEEDTLVFVVTQDTIFELRFEIDRHHIEVAPNNIAYGSVYGTNDYEYGTAASVGAHPYSGYQFLRWSNGVTYNPYTFAVLCDTSLTAIFAEEGTVYNVTATADDPTMGIVTGGSIYAAGEQATLSAVPYDGYRFNHWQDNNTDNPRTITVNSDMSFTAYFKSDGTQGIEDMSGETEEVRVYASNGCIVIGTQATTPAEVHIYDITGRHIATTTSAVWNTARVPVSGNGVYIIKVTNFPAKKVVVIR